MELYKGNDVWKRLACCKRPIVLYGTGNGADKILDELEKLGVSVYGITASDGFVRNRSFRGFTVKALSEIETEVAEPVIVIAFGSQRTDVIENILSLSERHTVLCADVPVYGKNIFNRAFYDEHKDEFQMAYNILSDELSRHTFESIVNFKLSGELEYLTKCFSGKDEAFRGILRLGNDESYLDLGAYRGDTIEEFLRYTKGSYSHITALEPDKKTYKKLKAYAGEMDNVQLFNMGIWSEDDNLAFNSSLGRGSSIDNSGAQALAVTKIDTLCKKRSLTYLKADVEGAEEQALIGGVCTLKRDKPKLNIALYHRSEDIFKLPLLISSIRSDYKFFIRQHPHIPSWDLNLYAY